MYLSKKTLYYLNNTPNPQHAIIITRSYTTYNTHIKIILTTIKSQNVNLVLFKRWKDNGLGRGMGSLVIRGFS